MPRSHSGGGAAVSRAGWGVVGAGLLLSGCAAAAPTGAAPVPAHAAADWQDRTYTLTCDGVVPGGFRATLVDGSAQVPADGSRPPFYDHYEVRLMATASGDVDGDGAPDAVVLLDCSPQPSNGIVQEVEVFAATGDPLGDLPSPRTLQGDALLPPEYDPAGLTVQDGGIVAAMKAYGPGDVHATGPSVPVTVRWRFDGQEFVRTGS